MENENFGFDKFIEDICNREDAQREIIREHQEGQDEHPSRVYNRLYRERWQNRIKWDNRK